jgi:FtsP/CotA-like multicopper oxidase with cupredoxin domain
VPPGGEFVYDFTAGPSGTKMYHCHVESPHHITMGMFGALIIDPAQDKGGPNEGDPFERDPAQDAVLIFNEFDTGHQHISFPGEMMPMGPDGQLPWLMSPGRKFMMPFTPELNEFLINGKSFPATRPLVVREGDVIRLRLINLGLQVHSIHIHGHEFTVTHRDGYKLPAPFKADTLGINPGERYDVWFEANNPGVWMIHDHAGMNAMANGYDPGGIMMVLQYEGMSTVALDHFLERARVYEENIEHMDEGHGSRTPTTEVGGQAMGDMDMGGGH